MPSRPAAPSAIPAQTFAEPWPRPSPRPRAAITDPERIGGLLRAIDGYTGHFPTLYALQLAPLVFTRPGELRAAEWAEIDLDAAEWIIPAARMKMRAEHIVPLSTQAVAILRAAHLVSGNGRFVFPGVRSRARPLSDNTINAALRRLGYANDEMTGHGFRALAPTRLNEMGWPPDVIERQLAHAEANKVRAVYNRAQYLPERRNMMQAWADYLDGLKFVSSSATNYESSKGLVVPLVNQDGSNEAANNSTLQSIEALSFGFLVENRRCLPCDLQVYSREWAELLFLRSTRRDDERGCRQRW